MDIKISDTFYSMLNQNKQGKWNKSFVLFIYIQYDPLKQEKWKANFQFNAWDNLFTS